MNQKEKNNLFFRQLLFLIMLVGIGVVIYQQLKFFIGAFLGAITMYIVLRHLMFRFTEKYHWKKWIASLVFSGGLAVVLAGVGYLVFELTASQMPTVDGSKIVPGIRELADKVRDVPGLNNLSDKIIGQATGVVSGFVSSALNTTYSFAANIFMMIVILYFMLGAGRKMEAAIFQYMPMHGKSLDMVKQEVKDMVFSNAIGIPLVMLVQGISACLIYMLFGVSHPIFWAFLTALCGLLPVVGTAIVYIPMGIVLITTGGLWEGLALIACGLLIISNLDNLVRIVWMKKVADTHPLIVIFGVVLGIPLFGFWGIIFGPLLLAGFLLLIKIYYMEYGLLKDPPVILQAPPESISQEIKGEAHEESQEKDNKEAKSNPKTK